MILEISSHRADRLVDSRIPGHLAQQLEPNWKYKQHRTSSLQ